MKKVIKKICCCVFVVLIMFSTIESNVVLAGTSKPTSTWNLKSVGNDGNGTYKGSGSCETVNLYSNYLFTGVAKMKIAVTNKSTSNEIKVKVYKKQKTIDSCVSTVTIPANGKTSWTISVSSDGEYYVKFMKPAKFSWTVKKG